MMISSMHSDSVTLSTGEFADTARLLADTARRLGLVAPGFRCPSRIVGVDRTLRRFSGDEPAGVVAVNIKDRPLAAVLADMIEGVVVLNGLSAHDATRVRAELWATLQHTARHVHVA
jgi:hypothetical protein